MSSVAQGHTSAVWALTQQVVIWSFSSAEHWETTLQGSQFEAPQHKTDADILDGASLTDHQDDYRAEVCSVWGWRRCLLTLRRKGRKEKSHYCITLPTGMVIKKTKSNSFQLFLELNHPLTKGNWQYQQHRKFWLDTGEKFWSGHILPRETRPWRYSNLDWIWPGAVRFDLKAAKLWAG